MTTFIFDASHHDEDRGSIDWTRVRASGIEIAIHKATEGDPAGYSFTDPKFQGAVTSARAAGMRLIGGYHCLSHGDAASWSRQVDFFIQYLNQVGGFAKGWAMIDVEPFQELKSRNVAPTLADVIGFANAWKAKTNGFPLAAYIPKWYWEEWGSPTLSGHVDLLIASNYPVSASQPYATLYTRDGGDSGVGWAPYGGVTPFMWQYASTNQIPGVVGNCDCNAFKGTADQFVTKVTGVETPAAHPAFPGRILKKTVPTMHGDDVKTWQRRMAQRGWKISVDGFYGPESQNVCRSFQVEFHITQDRPGEVGATTWNSAWTLKIT